MTDVASAAEDSTLEAVRRVGMDGERVVIGAVAPRSRIISHCCNFSAVDPCFAVDYRYWDP